MRFSVSALVLALPLLAFHPAPVSLPGLDPAGTAQAQPTDTTWEYANERQQMVETQIADRDVRDPDVLAAMRSVPRHRFVPDVSPGQAYTDQPLPIGFGQTISQPYIVAKMTQLVRPDSADRALEVGTGSAYHAAVLSRVVDSVYTVEIIPELATRATQRLDALGYGNVVVRNADGYHGWAAPAPFDVIVVTAAAQHIPPPLVQQLAPDGRMVIPVGSPFRTQTLMLVTKTGGEIRTESIAPVRFVPLKRSPE